MQSKILWVVRLDNMKCTENKYVWKAETSLKQIEITKSGNKSKSWQL